MVPDMLVGNRISLDEKGVFYHGPAIHSVVFNNEVKHHSPYFYLGILNSSLFWFFIVNTSTALRGNAYRLTPEFLTPFSFPEVTANNKALYEKIVTQVERMLQLNRRLADIGDKKTDERARVELEIGRTGSELDEAIFNLYGVSEEDKELIGSTWK